MSATNTLATSQEIRDRGSTFVGSIYRATSVEQAKEFARRQHPRQGQADARSSDDAYAIAAWRVMVVKPGKTGLGGSDDFEVCEGWEDGGERWAGRRVLGVMQREAVVDAIVVVHRWCVSSLCDAVQWTVSLSGLGGRCWDRCGSRMWRHVRARSVVGSERWRRWKSVLKSCAAWTNSWRTLGLNSHTTAVTRQAKSEKHLIIVQCKRHWISPRQRDSFVQGNAKLKTQGSCTASPRKLHKSESRRTRIMLADDKRVEYKDAKSEMQSIWLVALPVVKALGYDWGGKRNHHVQCQIIYLPGY